jgi:adenosine deaminase CECR1
MERSRVFRVIRKMPKGGVLHAHISAITSRDFILGNITRRPNLYVCRKQESLELHFLDETAARNRSECDWQLLEDARRADVTIDEEIAQALTLYADEQPLVAAEGIDNTWKKFLNIFCFIKSLVTYRYGRNLWVFFFFTICN